MIASWKISLRFFSPPEKPTFTPRLSSDSSMCRTASFSRTRARKSIASSSGSPRCLRIALTAALRK